MTRLIRVAIVFCLSLMLSACLYGQCLDGPCALERERILKNMKSLGEQWSKAGMTRESWRQDWVDCGGMSDGGYANDAPQFSSGADIDAAGKRIRRKLADCMSAKGYLRDYHPPE